MASELTAPDERSSSDAVIQAQDMADLAQVGYPSDDNTFASGSTLLSESTEPSDHKESGTDLAGEGVETHNDSLCILDLSRSGQTGAISSAQESTGEEETNQPEEKEDKEEKEEEKGEEKEKEEDEDEEIEPLSPEALIGDVCRIDGRYELDTFKHVYCDYNPAMGPPSGRKSGIPRRYHEWALLLIRQFDEQLELQRTYLQINSSLILQALKNASRSEKASFERAQIPWPNDDIFRYRELIREAAKGISDLAIKHVDVLLRLVEAEFADRLADLKNLLPKGIVSFAILRELFWPGDIVISFESAEPRAYRVLGASFKKVSSSSPIQLKIKAEYIDFDGDNLGTVKSSLYITEFEDVMYLRDLTICPLAHVPNKEAVLERLEKRGTKFLSLKGKHFKFCDGVANSLDYGRAESYSNMLTVQVRSRVMVDASMLKEFHPSDSFEVSSRENQDEQSELSREELLICTNVVLVFSFKHKSCFWVNVHHISDIAFNDRAFDQLILPPAQKDLVRAFTNSYSAGDEFDDFIAGKGKGLVFLLHGPPGVGKTMTAEAISDLLRRPLYAITSGELGTSPSEMERNLENALDKASFLSAVLLLDEADVFLEQRNVHDLTRNALVSTFLRLIEYYKGVMFLTTNRVNIFDTAVSSRVHITLHLNELTIESRESVWRNLSELNKVDLDATALAHRPLNGRQIKNAFRSGMILAKDKGETLSTEHVQTVFEAMTFMES
ncbi:hypothetical protein N7457_000139 [Penicillium paradoxum]|uniref:uncharacterized protein n=1 Tax=Penicillium paradoxum TaxID=176176 RepID=UPI002548A242|nr:uncharacterized protein N7457_000139 [Penicillium paradoxum]KAJ5793540.1 hypothetical protein N7457_000139 [Penicillium paradoxum]